MAQDTVNSDHLFADRASLRRHARSIAPTVGYTDLLLGADLPLPRIKTELEQLPHYVGSRRAFGLSNTVEHVYELLGKR